jgi:hypothetical protein
MVKVWAHPCLSRSHCTSVPCGHLQYGSQYHIGQPSRIYHIHVSHLEKEVHIPRKPHNYFSDMYASRHSYGEYRLISTLLHPC